MDRQPDSKRMAKVDQEDKFDDLFFLHHPFPIHLPFVGYPYAILGGKKDSS